MEYEKMYVFKYVYRNCKMYSLLYVLLGIYTVYVNIVNTVFD